MTESLEARRLRALALAAACALAFGGTACGSDDGDGGGERSQAAEVQGGSSEGNPKQKVEADYDAFIDAIYDQRWADACARYSKAYAAQYTKQAKLSKSCEGTVKLEYAAIGTQPRPWLAKVRLVGPTRAIGLTKTRAKSQGIPIKLVEEDGVWKLDGTAVKGA